MTSAPPSKEAEPAGAPRRRVRWGIGDLLLVQLVSLGVTSFVAAPAYSGEHRPGALYQFGVLLPVQQVTVLLGLLLVSRRKGRGTLRQDFGLHVDRADLRLVGFGVALQLLSLLVIPLRLLGGNDDDQQILEDLKHSTGVLPSILFLVGAVLMAPLVEELLYRGLLLRALLRRTEPAMAVVGSALIFAAMHALFDPNALPLVPALTGLGIILGLRALRTGSLSQPIVIHAGFNLATAILYLISDAS